LLITIPDLQKICEFVVKDKLEETIYQSPAGHITPLDVIYGFRTAVARGNTFMAHKTGFSAETLGERLRCGGFCNIQVQRRLFHLLAVAYKSHGNLQYKANEIQFVDEIKIR